MWQNLRQRYACSLLAQAQFRRLWLNAFAAEIGARFSVVAIPLLAIAELGAGPFQTGLMVACHAAAFAIASLLAGVLADRTPPKRLLISGQLIIASALLTVPCAHLLGWLRIEWLYALEIVVGLGVAIMVAAGHIYSARLAGPARVVEANSLFFGCDSLASLLGPGIAGWFVGWLTPVWAISIDSLCIGISIFLLLPNPELAVVRHAHEKAASLFADFRQGWRAVWQDRVLRLLSVSSACFQILFHGHIALQVLLATQVLGLSPFAFGVAMMLGGGGALVASLLTSQGVRLFGEKRLLLLSLAALSAAWLALALLPRSSYTMLLYAPVMFAFDMAITAFGILFVSTRQIASPPALLGRVTATSRFVAFAAAPLGGILFGWLAEHAGLRWTYAVMGWLGLALALVLGWMLRNILLGASAAATASNQAEGAASS